jgi:hypothetical protein
MHQLARFSVSTLSPTIHNLQLSLQQLWEGHMVQALLAHTGGLFWNLSADVGPGQPNRPDDVEFVRFGYFLMKDNPKAMNGPFAALKPVLQHVTPTGVFDNALAEAIRAHQRVRGGTQDGRISVARDNKFNLGAYDGKNTWIVFPLNNSMIELASNIYPRIDLHPQSGPAVSTSVRKICLHGRVV